jgi:spermidine/putrescine transport system substrate-binding protein
VDEALAKLRTGQVDFDVYFPDPSFLGRLVLGDLLQPLNHDYIPNLAADCWPAFRNPFYDRQWRYTVPYTIYTTGITWRVDYVHDDIAGMSNPYDVFWDPKWKGKIHLLDDYREAMAMVLMRNGITDVNTGSHKSLDLVGRQLLDCAQKVSPALDVSDYTDVPEGKAWIHQAWSGDMVTAQYYMPKGQSPKVIRYWYPPDGRGVIGNDLIAILSSGRNPVLAHHFLNYMLDYNVAMKNFGWNGYQPPQTRVNPDKLVAQGYIPETMKSAVVRQSDFDRGFELLELSPPVDAAWHDVWQQFKAGS